MPTEHIPPPQKLRINTFSAKHCNAYFRCRAARNQLLSVGLAGNFVLAGGVEMQHFKGGHASKPLAVQPRYLGAGVPQTLADNYL
ncbi:MAG: hypothetical protein RSA26_00030 [Mucinivorans sp.]